MFFLFLFCVISSIWCVSGYQENGNWQESESTLIRSLSFQTMDSMDVVRKNENGKWIRNEFSLVQSSGAPTNLSYPDGVIYRTGSVISLVPTYSGSVSWWSISPSLPSFLTWDSQTGTISGRLEESFETVFTITAGNENGSVSYVLVLSVLNSGCLADGEWPVTNSLQTVYLPCSDEFEYVGNQSRTCVGYAIPTWGPITRNCELGPPYALRYPYRDYNVFTGIEVTNLIPSHRGKGIEYSVSPSLPEGLILDSSTGEIHGTVKSEEPCTTVTVTLVNEVGNCTTSLRICVIPSDRSESPLFPQPRQKFWLFLSIGILTVSIILSIAFLCCGCRCKKRRMLKVEKQKD